MYERVRVFCEMSQKGTWEGLYLIMSEIQKSLFRKKIEEGDDEVGGDTVPPLGFTKPR